MRAFFDDMLRFDDLAVLAKDPGIYPTFGAETSWTRASRRCARWSITCWSRKRDYRDLFTTRETFISPPLAVIYDVAAPPGWSSYTSPRHSPRAGLLTQVSFLAAHAHPGRSSPTLRGKALRELLLCQAVPRPPPNVDFSLLEDARLAPADRARAPRPAPHQPGVRRLPQDHRPDRARLRALRRRGPVPRRPSAARTIDASGVLDGRQFEDLAGLSQALHDHPQLGACLVKRVYAWATGGATQPADKPMLDWLGRAVRGRRLPPAGPVAHRRAEQRLCDRARGRAGAGDGPSRTQRSPRPRRAAGGKVTMIRSAKTCAAHPPARAEGHAERRRGHGRACRCSTAC